MLLSNFTGKTDKENQIPVLRIKLDERNKVLEVTRAKK